MGKKRHTFAVNPQKRRSRLPILVYSALEEPGRCPFMLCTAGNVVASRGIRRGQPFLDFLTQLTLYVWMIEPQQCSNDDKFGKDTR